MTTLARLLALVLLPLPFVAAAREPPESLRAPYPLLDWRSGSCGAKGRFQDREYCRSSVMDRIAADGKNAIPTLIAQTFFHPHRLSEAELEDIRLNAQEYLDLWHRDYRG